MRGREAMHEDEAIAGNKANWDDRAGCMCAPKCMTSEGFSPTERPFPPS